MRILVLILFIVTAAIGNGAEPLKVIKQETIRRGFNERLRVEVSYGTSEASSTFTITAVGRLDDGTGKSRVLSNRAGTLLAFNIRKGVGIYGMGLISLQRDDTLVVVPNLEEVVVTQMIKVDRGLAAQCLRLKKVEGNHLTIGYVGEEVSPNYFNVYADVIAGRVQVDLARLRKRPRRVFY